MDNGWLMQKFPGLSPDWFGETRLSSSKKLNISLEISLSKISPQIGGNKQDCSFLGLVYHLYYR